MRRLASGPLRSLRHPPTVPPPLRREVVQQRLYARGHRREVPARRGVLRAPLRLAVPPLLPPVHPRRRARRQVPADSPVAGSRFRSLRSSAARPETGGGSAEL